MYNFFIVKSFNSSTLRGTNQWVKDWKNSTTHKLNVFQLVLTYWLAMDCHQRVLQHVIPGAYIQSPGTGNTIANLIKVSISVYFEDGFCMSSKSAKPIQLKFSRLVCLGVQGSVLPRQLWNRVYNLNLS